MKHHLGATNPRYQTKLRLGSVNFAKTAREEGRRRAPHKDRRLRYLTISTVVLLLVGIGVTLGSVLNGGPEADESLDVSDGGGTGGITPTVPSASPTNDPTIAPTKFPTSSPTNPTVTLEPTATPSRAPIAGCTSFDAVCGCNLEVGKRQDILWIIDESRSVGHPNYQLMRSAIRDFSLNFTFGPDEIRMGVIEYDAVINHADTIDFDQYNATGFSQNALEQFDCKPTGTESSWQCPCGTDSAGALIFAKEYLARPQNVLRENSNLIIIIISDGFPCCRTNSNCCKYKCDSYNVYGQVTNNKNEDQALVIQSLQELRADFNFSMIYIPITTSRGKAGAVDSFGFADQEPYNGLTEEEFQITDFVVFDELFEFFSNSSFQLPLAPCVTPPPTVL